MQGEDLQTPDFVHLKIWQPLRGVSLRFQLTAAWKINTNKFTTNALCDALQQRVP